MRKIYKNQYEKMTEKPVNALILELGIPTTISMLITNIYNMADTYFVGKLGTSASGAIGVVFALMAIIQAFGFMLGHGAGSNISRQLGAKNVERARIFASTSFFMSIVCGILIMIIGLVFCNPLMRLLGSTETILPYSRAYARFILIAAPAMAASCVMNNILRYEGRATFAMIGLTLGGVLNIFGDAIFMFGFGMGVEGAGLSTAISQYISAIVLLSMFLRKKTQSRFSLKYITRDLKDVASIITVGLPSMARQGLNSVSTMILNLQASIYGDAAIAAMSIVGRVANFLFCVGLGIGQGFQPVSGFNYGAKKYSRVKEGFNFTLKFGTCILSVFALIGFIFAGPIVHCFRDDMMVVEIGTVALRIQCIALIFVPLSVCGNMLFQSIGKSGRATLLACMRSGLCFIPILLILSNTLGLTGIQISQPIADVVSGVLTVPFFVKFLKTLPEDAVDCKLNEV